MYCNSNYTFSILFSMSKSDATEMGSLAIETAANVGTSLCTLNLLEEYNQGI
jgi:hypothetical protein